MKFYYFSFVVNGKFGSGIIHAPRFLLSKMTKEIKNKTKSKMNPTIISYQEISKEDYDAFSREDFNL